MPHSTTEPTVNGDSKRSSQFISHLTSYPVVSDGISTFKENPYGRKSLELADGVYSRFAKPVEPYVVPSYERYAAPYVARADELADTGLSKVDTRFPIVKEDTNTLLDYGRQVLFSPLRLLDDGRNYLLTTWHDEYKKTAQHNGRGPGMTTNIMALISTELKVASDFFARVAEVLGPKYEEGKNVVAAKADALRDAAGTYADQAAAYERDLEHRANDYVRAGREQAAAYTQAGLDTAEAWRRRGADKAQEGKNKAGETVEQGKQKVDAHTK